MSEAEKTTDVANMPEPNVQENGNAPEQPKQEEVDSSTIFPTESFKQPVESTFDAMIRDFNHFRNNSKSEDVKDKYLKAINTMNKAKAEVMDAINDDVKARKLS